MDDKTLLRLALVVCTLALVTNALVLKQLKGTTCTGGTTAPANVYLLDEVGCNDLCKKLNAGPDCVWTCVDVLNGWHKNCLSRAGNNVGYINGCDDFARIAGAGGAI